jgi:hypothetical protein
MLCCCFFKESILVHLLGSPALVEPSIIEPIAASIVTSKFLHRVVGPAKQSGDPAYIPAMATIMDKHSIAKG